MWESPELLAREDETQAFATLGCFNNSPDYGEGSKTATLTGK